MSNPSHSSNANASADKPAGTLLRTGALVGPYVLGGYDPSSFSYEHSGAAGASGGGPAAPRHPTRLPLPESGSDSDAGLQMGLTETTKKRISKEDAKALAAAEKHSGAPKKRSDRKSSKSAASKAGAQKHGK